MKRPSPQTLSVAEQERSLEAVVVQVTEGPDAGLRVTLRAGRMTVGTEEACELVLTDPTVSGRHASLELLYGAVLVRDLGSRNGVRYAGARLQEARVPLGGLIALGRSTLQLTREGPPLVASERASLHGLLGASLAMRQLYPMIERLGPQDSTVLIKGETGAGKQLVGEAIHACSSRAQRPFVVCSCASHAELFESELFGHTQGAFTGAHRARGGLLEQAEGGVLFFDQIDAFPLASQSKLLRLLETRRYTPVGSAEERAADVRIIAASSSDLWAEARAGRFRPELYHRLAVLEVTVPPLRDRGDDIALLATHFARLKTGIEVSIDRVTMATLRSYSWPGNVRELKNAIERVVTLGELSRAEGQPVQRGNETYKDARSRLLERFERDYLVALLEVCGGNVASGAKRSGLSRSQLYRLCAKHGIVVAKDE